MTGSVNVLTRALVNSLMGIDAAAAATVTWTALLVQLLLLGAFLGSLGQLISYASNGSVRKHGWVHMG